MHLPPQHRRVPSESIVPMINVVFLLLIFFMMTATLTTDDPAEITPPNASGPAADAIQNVVYIDATGALFFGDAEGDAVFMAIEDAQITQISLRADGAAQAQRIAKLSSQLATIGVTSVTLVAVAQ